MTTTWLPAVVVGTFASPLAAFRAAGLPLSLATVAAAEIARDPEAVPCVAIAASLAAGGTSPAGPAWTLDPSAAEACVASVAGGSFALMAALGSVAHADEDWVARQALAFQEASGAAWVVVSKAGIPEVASLELLASAPLAGHPQLA